MDESDFRPLLFLGELIANLATREAALRRKVEVLERHVLRRFLDARLHHFLVLQAGLLGRDKAEHDLLALGDVRQRLETARARRVELQIERVDVFMGEQIRRHRVVAALERVGGVVIAAAYVGVNHEVFGRAFDSGVVQRYAELLTFWISTACMPVFATKSVSQ